MFLVVPRQRLADSQLALQAAAGPAGSSTAMYQELYDHRADDGVDFDAMDTVNLAYSVAHAEAVAELLAVVTGFFWG